ncbi:MULTISPECIES: discoidin domain-containing protein [unclassified Clostridioides]|uniref:discoidin domain-containing protein n=1 Tax=unclassified Clostridioides TaxID=2635829 RepID=UPI001D127779|nr:discoidin domain-containing protein [Clostridioides sp. ES-S-0049-03]MCC0675358.1 discoidin domain-containing protein [Clostridioides sp. ES-W-0018-02]MCC0709833.1 discoidin domain-containing protein [Clostridioides sp. ES-W-0017-02]
MTRVGDSLPQPEAGWRRYDDNYKDIIYSEKYNKMRILTCYGGECSYVDNIPYDETSIKFAFVGTKIRIICVNYIDRSDIVDIDIDGVVEQFSTKENIQNTSKVDYEKLNLENKIHNVKISVNKNSQGVHLLFDCIDIDEDGYILSPIEGTLLQRTSIEDMEIGDIISCRYTASTTGKIGGFSELGKCNCEEIPRDVSSSTPDGKFFFVKVDDNKLIADRNIQNNISWNEINGNLDMFYKEKIFPLNICESDETDEYVLKASSVYNERYAYKAFGSKLGWHSKGVGYPHTLQVTFKTQPQRINFYKFHFGNSEQFPQSATEWTIEASNDELNWVILHTVKENPAPKHDQIKNYIFKNENFYAHYRIKITNSNSVDKSVAIKCLDFFYKKFSMCLPDGGVAYNNDITVSFPKKALNANETDEYILEQSSTYSTGFLAYLDFNKTNIDSNDCWHSNSEPNPYIKVSSKKDKIQVSGFRLTNRNCPGSIQPPSSCTVYGSNDNTVFEKIYETSNLPSGNKATSYHYFNSQVEYLHYKFNFQHADLYIAVGELELFKEYEYKDSPSSLVNKNQGGWPTNNDWDKYIWKNNLNGKIDAGDNNIWNYKYLVSFTKNIAILSIQSIYGNIPDGNRIVVRGYNDQYVNDNSPKRLDISITTHKSSTFGFRPMLIIRGEE